MRVIVNTNIIIRTHNSTATVNLKLLRPLALGTHASQLIDITNKNFVNKEDIALYVTQPWYENRYINILWTDTEDGIHFPFPSEFFSWCVCCKSKWDLLICGINWSISENIVPLFYDDTMHDAPHIW